LVGWLVVLLGREQGFSEQPPVRRTSKICRPVVFGLLLSRLREVASSRGPVVTWASRERNASPPGRELLVDGVPLASIQSRTGVSPCCLQGRPMARARRRAGAWPLTVPGPTLSLSSGPGEWGRGPGSQVRVGGRVGTPVARSGGERGERGGR